MKTWHAVLKRPDYPFLEYGSYDLYEAIMKACKIGWNYIAYCEEYVVTDKYPQYKGTTLGDNKGLFAVNIRHLDSFTDDEIERLRIVHDIGIEV